MENLLELGYLGLFIGSFLASTIIPLSADILLIGMIIADGDLTLCLTLATIGNWLGGMTSYTIGRLGKWEIIEKWFKIDQQKIHKQKRYIDKYGICLAFFTWLPIIGDFFSIALGFYKTNIYKVGTTMLIGRFIRFITWIIITENF